MEKWRLKIVYFLREEPGIGGHFFLWIKRMSVKLQQLKVWHLTLEDKLTNAVKYLPANRTENVLKFWFVTEIKHQKRRHFTIYTAGDKWYPMEKDEIESFPDTHTHTHTHARARARTQNHWMGSQGPDEYTFQFQKIR